MLHKQVGAAERALLTDLVFDSIIVINFFFKKNLVFAYWIRSQSTIDSVVFDWVNCGKIIDLDYHLFCFLVSERREILEYYPGK